VAMDLMDGEPPLNLDGLSPGAWRPVNDNEDQRLLRLLQTPGRDGLAGGGKSGRRGGGG